MVQAQEALFSTAHVCCACWVVLDVVYRSEVPLNGRKLVLVDLVEDSHLELTGTCASRRDVRSVLAAGHQDVLQAGRDRGGVHVRVGFVRLNCHLTRWRGI